MDNILKCVTLNNSWSTGRELYILQLPLDNVGSRVIQEQCSNPEKKRRQLRHILGFGLRIESQKERRFTEAEIYVILMW